MRWTESCWWLAAVSGLVTVAASRGNITPAVKQDQDIRHAAGLYQNDAGRPDRDTPTRVIDIDDYRGSATDIATDQGWTGDLRARQDGAAAAAPSPAATGSARFTTIAVALATATETLLPIVGLDGQIVTPVVVPTGPGQTAAPSLSVVTAAPLTVTMTMTMSAAGSTVTVSAAAVTVTGERVTVTQVGAGPQVAVTVTQAETITQAGTAPPTTVTVAANGQPLQAQGTMSGAASQESGGAALGETPLAAGAEPPVTAELVIDPAQGPFLGGQPNSNIDLPVTLVFLGLFLLGAFTHISIYRANSARKHKFLLSDLVFDFCMVRSVTCIFRVVEIFSQVRPVVLLSLIFLNGGAVVLFVVNIFFTQRIVRSMHPHFGWTPAFRFFTLLLAFSVPTVVVLNLVSLSISFYSVGNASRLDTLEKLLKFGASWNMFLSVYPLIALLLSAALPGPRIEGFGRGPYRVKIAVLSFASMALAVGAAVRLATTFNPIRPGTEDDSPLFGKANFYTTGFMLELLVVILYAAARVDLLFHVPDGSLAPGDYSKGYRLDDEGKEKLTKDKIEEMIEDLGAPHQIFDSATSLLAGHKTDAKPLFAVFYPGSDKKLAPRRWNTRDTLSTFNLDSEPPTMKALPTTTKTASEDARVSPTAPAPAATGRAGSEYYGEKYPSSESYRRRDSDPRRPGSRDSYRDRDSYYDRRDRRRDSRESYRRRDSNEDYRSRETDREFA